MIKKIFLATICLLPTISFAEPTRSLDLNQHLIIAPHCLIKNLSASFETISSSDQLALIVVNESGLSQLTDAKTQNKTPCGGFMDVTEEWQTYTSKRAIDGNAAKAFLNSYTTPAKSLAPVTYNIQYPTQVNQLIKQMNREDMWTDLTTLTSFNDRYANSDNGVKAANWIKSQVETLAKNTGHNDVTVYFVNTGNYQQPSVVAKVGNSSLPGVVIGGHMDTTRGQKPGADDDGTGTVTVLETARTILASKMQFKKPIYFIWYAAEEMGLVGSKYVVTDFKNKNIPVDAVMQLDMTGYAYRNEPTMWLINDYVNKDLTAYLETLIKTYVNQPVKYTQCGYACSDHASWHLKGFNASMPAEAAFENTNPALHTSQDTMEKLSLAHMADYAKLAVAFAVELAEPVA